MNAGFFSVVKKKYCTANTEIIHKCRNTFIATDIRTSGSRFCLTYFTASHPAAARMSITTTNIATSFQEKARYLPNLPIAHANNIDWNSMNTSGIAFFLAIITNKTAIISHTMPDANVLE